MAWMRAETPYLYRWLDLADDASGVDGDWSDEISIPVKVLLAVAGNTYLPFLQANLDALDAGEKTFSLSIEDGRYEQGTFGYQAKCLKALRGFWSELKENDRAKLADWIGPNTSLLN